jgi:starch phosphorylase
VPTELADIRDLALDLAWTWDARISRLFEVIDPEAWEASKHNPVTVLQRLHESPADLFARPEVAAALEGAHAAYQEMVNRRPSQLDAGAPLCVGYFSLEFGLSDCLPIFSGGLGILAGDHLKAAANLGLPLVGIGLLYRQGFGRQRIGPDGGQEDIYTESRPEELPLARVNVAGAPLTVSAPVGDGSVQIAVWRVRIGSVDLFLLDTDLESNPPELRSITDRLYVPEPRRRLLQEIVLGLGGVRALRGMGIEATVFHLNEGHGFLVALDRMRELRQRRQFSVEEARLVARAGVVFTTHTPVAAGSDYFHPELVRELLSPYLKEVGLSFDGFMDLGRRVPGDHAEHLCTTYVGLRMADHAVGVSRLHGSVSRRLWKDAWPGLPESQVPIGHVTNGVHMPSWVAPPMAGMLAREVDPEWWDLDPADPRWDAALRMPDEQLWEIHQGLRRYLVEFARGRGEGSELDPEALTIGFGRRFAPYKRANMLLGDSERLVRLLSSSERPVQFLFAGKAHPADEPGKSLLREVVAAARAHPRLVFLADYDIELARRLVQGCDVWLNNPRRFLEASGTSGMKAGANGVLNLSVLDGWWEEGYRPGAGWAIPSGATLDRPGADDAAEAEALYRLLEREVIPAFYERDGQGLPRRWLQMMKASIRLVGARFSARRMLMDYFEQAYGPAARRFEQLRLLPDLGG